ncbi:hypothetical protein [Quisquiliibacterium transsilvanicum]|uniref:EF-hand domain-containing protein n=1 Tax=Quisquiliibacterium transsilvanicum TaxID=1549638 RepID=A0A7W8M9V0_9BURK|nr:hypothetical protein [Quisquiliibacterium transsilvanicum]MBB5272474.1 hypothetical protein [Quisquiliibacterium transsilvanicum]
MNAIRLSLAAGALAFGGILFAQTTSGQDATAAQQPAAGTAAQAPAGPGYGPRGGGPGEGMHRHHRDGKHGHRGGLMMGADQNRDGKVSRDELLEAQKRQLAMFERADADKDGTLTRDEMRAARETMREEYRKSKGEPRRDGERRGPAAPQAPAAGTQG